MKQTKNLPNPDRLSILIAVILLAFVLAKFTEISVQSYNLDIAGIHIPLEINIKTLVALIVTGMTAAGSDWLIRNHPNRKNKSTITHWLLPAFTTWVIHVALSTLSISTAWWITFGFGGFLILLVLLGEYILMDPEDIRYPLAEVGLNALAYSLFLVLTVSLKSIDLRLVFILPALTLAAGVVSMRILNIALKKEWPIPEALISVIIISQFTTVFQYMPINIITFGLLLLGLIYSINTFIVNLSEENNIMKAALEPIAVLFSIWILALVIG